MARSNELSEALSRLMVKQPFFSCLIMDLLIIKETDAVPTAGTDGQYLHVNPEWFNRLNIGERTFVLAHEVMHVILEHCKRNRLYLDRGFGPDLNPWKPGKWNSACDYIINNWLGEISDIGTLPHGGLHHPNYTKGDIADEVYCQLPDEDDDGGGGCTNGSGNWDHHMPGDPAKQPSKADVQRAVTAAANAAKAMGKEPAGMQRLVDSICEPQIDWSERLSLSVAAVAGRDSATWARPNRRRLILPPNAYFPGTTGVSVGNIVMWLDTSGSVSEKELSHFLGECAGLFTSMKPERLYVGAVDSNASEPELLSDAAELENFPLTGGGGTDMGIVFPSNEKYLNFRPDACIILTDGYTPWGDEPNYPVIWIITEKSITAPFGETIHLPVRQ